MTDIVHLALWLTPAVTDTGRPICNAASSCIQFSGRSDSSSLCGIAQCLVSQSHFNGRGRLIKAGVIRLSCENHSKPFRSGFLTDCAKTISGLSHAELKTPPSHGQAALHEKNTPECFLYNYMIVLCMWRNAWLPVRLCLQRSWKCRAQAACWCQVGMSDITAAFSSKML